MVSFQLVCAGFLVCSSAATWGAGTDWLGPTAAVLDPDGKTLYLACERARQIAIVDLRARELIRSYRLKDSPTGLMLGGVPSRLVVTCSGKQNVILCLDPRTGRVLGQWPAGNGVCSPVGAASPNRIYVCNRYDGTVSLMDTISGRELARMAADRQPVALSLSPETGILAVANLLPSGPANKTVVQAIVSLVNLEGFRKQTSVSLPNGSTSVRSLAFHPKRDLCAVVHNIARFQVPTTQVENGWMNVSALSLLTTEPPTLRATVMLDEPWRGAANPSSVAWTPDGQKLCITHAGTHELSVIDFPGLEGRLANERKGKLVADLDFLKGIRNRVKLGGNGPRAMALSHGVAYVAEFFSDSVTAVDLSSSSMIYTIPLANGDSEDRERAGERVFNDATLCHQAWQSCATCHPDGRADGLNWDLLNDGIGNPKNTKSLLLATQTPPAMSLGGRATASAAIRAGFRHILFSSQSEDVVGTVGTYLVSLKPVPSPYLVQGRLSSAARRGRRIFAQGGCIMCHPPGLFTDQNSYDVGTAGPSDKQSDKFDTPSLVELWRTAPYLHDGSAKTIHDVLTTKNHADKHGTTSRLSTGQLNDLTIYLLSL